jgi:hypothetical protein
MYKNAGFILIALLTLVSCKSTEEFTGFSYDPPDVTNTTDKEIKEQPRRVIGAGAPKVWVSNEFEGARLSNFVAINDTLFEIYIEPENAPINNSPWYAFKIWSDTVRMATLKLNYMDAKHRYVPKLLSWVESDSSWQQQMELPVKYDSVEGTGMFEILLTSDPVIVSAQPLKTSSQLFSELKEREVLGKDFVTIQQAGESKLGRPIWQLEISETTSSQIAPVLAIVGRQHPPEVTGYIASLFFLEELASDSELASEFRETFVVKAFPLLNPDGADMGHWRHNAGGVDLNRDWQNFNQPETRVVRDELLAVEEKENRKMFYGIDFHSTNENIFYPIDEEVKTEPDNVTQKWTKTVLNNHSDVEFTIEEFDTSSPIAKNWFYHTFGIDAVTYEVSDNIEPEKIEHISRSAARSLMRLLMEEWQKTTLEN